MGAAVREDSGSFVNDIWRKYEAKPKKVEARCQCL